LKNLTFFDKKLSGLNAITARPSATKPFHIYNKKLKIKLKLKILTTQI